MPSLAPLVVITATAEQTMRLGRCMGRHITDALAIRLQGDLGSGKTCFVRGLAQGLGVSERYDITSPTYTLVHEYEGRVPLFHVDLYRLNSSFDAEAIGLWDIFASDAVVVVEWAQRLDEKDWPERFVRIDFQTVDETTRRITLNPCGLAMDNLINETVASFDHECTNLIK